MRRKDKEIQDLETINKVLETAEVCRVALSYKDNPYLIPMNFAYQDGFLYLHSATEGKKIEIIRKNPVICFQTDINLELVSRESPCDWSMRYYSVIGFGRAKIITNPSDKKKGLDLIMKKYSNQDDFNYSQQSLDALYIIKIRISHWTGKKSGYPD